MVLKYVPFVPFFTMRETISLKIKKRGKTTILPDARSVRRSFCYLRCRNDTFISRKEGGR